MKEPTRLLDDRLGTSDELRRALEQLSGTLPDPAQVAALASKLGVAQASAAAAKTASVAKLLAALGVGAALVGGAYLALRTDPPRAETPRSDRHTVGRGPAAPLLPAPVAGASAKQTARGAIEPARTGEPQAADQAPPPAELVHQSPERPQGAAAPDTRPRASVSVRRAPAASRDDSAAPSASPRPDTTPSSLSETELLGDARMALATSPYVALGFCEQHRRDFPGGVLAQEREVIAVTALVRLGRVQEATARAEHFRRTYPRSAYLPQLDRVLAAP